MDAMESMASFYVYIQITSSSLQCSSHCLIPQITNIPSFHNSASKSLALHSFMATQRPSSSTSEIKNSSSPGWKYEVFLSFHGKDTRKGFTGHLHDALKRKGILVFRDDETLKQGEYISEALLKGIQKSQYVIVILSANYASSKWCLMELAEIVEWEEKTKLITIIPIFNYVDPSDVRNLRGTFAKAFAAHEEDPKVDIKEIDMWKNALRKVGNIAGEHIKGDRYESTIIQKLCGRISNELNSRFSHYDYDKLVAIDSHVDEMMKLLDMESNDVRFVGIHGMGGVGKTTLAEIVYDRVSCQFEGSSFIPCIRENSTTARDLASLQKELLYMIMQEEIRVCNHHHGIRMISSTMRNKKVFIVLDDVDSEKKLMALAGDRKWFGPGSRVIITCRDSHLLRTHEVNDIYKVEQLEIEKALQLFSLFAFKQTHPTEKYKGLSMDFVNYTQGLPLALVVLGSFLFGRTMDAWKSERDKLKAIPNPKIMNVLQISFDGLQELQKELFLDMACLFRGHEDIFSEMLSERFGHYHIDVDVLVEKCLISKSKCGWLSMHDLLKELGREIVRRECPEEPGRRSRLFRVEDLYHVLKNDTGTDATKGIVLDFCPEKKDQRLNAKAFSKMRNLRYLIFYDSRTLKWRGDPLKYMPTNELRVLEWSRYHSKYWPSSFQPKNLTVLRMSGSRFKQLWKGSMVLDNLKEFDLGYSENLIEIPDLTGAPNLEKINLLGCRSLCEVHPSIGSLKKLKALGFDECSSLEKLPDLSSLECLTNLRAHETAITQIPSVNLMPKSIRRFRLQGCKLMRLKSRDPFYDIGSLVEYQKEGIYDYVEATWIDFDSKVENILDMADVGASALDDELKMISGWSWGFHIPEWVQYKSYSCSPLVMISLDANRNPEMGLTFFIVCDSDQFFSNYQFAHTSISSLFKGSITKSSKVSLTLHFRMDEDLDSELNCSFDLFPLDVYFGKQIGFWGYITVALWFLDIRRDIYIYPNLFDSHEKHVEVKDFGVHLVCPDDANSNFFNSIAPFGRSGSSNSDFHRQFFAHMRKKEDKERSVFHLENKTELG